MEKFLKEKLPGGEFSGVEQSHKQIMRAVRGKGNKTTEQRFETALVEAGVTEWEMHNRFVQGCPDFFFPRECVAVFLDGCFWHGCAQCGHIPKKNSEFWTAKISRNRDRDTKTTAIIRRKGMAVLRFWEHEIRDELEECISTLKKKLEQRRGKVTIFVGATREPGEP